MHQAMAKLLLCYADRNRYFQAGCKGYFLELLYYLAQHFCADDVQRSELIREQEHAATLQPVFEFVADNYAQPMTPGQAASMLNLGSFDETESFPLTEYSDIPSSGIFRVVDSC
jgi:hypothetical protein